jgi:hypothetical protein
MGRNIDYGGLGDKIVTHFLKRKCRKGSEKGDNDKSAKNR